MPPSETNQSFPFFTLAPELREQIYTSLLTTLSLTLPNNLILHASAIPLPNCLTLNRQFFNEYTSLSHKKSCLTISDSPHAISSLHATNTLPASIKHLEKIKFNIACTLFTHDAMSELEWHHKWTTEILQQLRNPKVVEILIHLAPGISALDYERALRWSGFWVDDTRTRELRVLRTGRGRGAWSFDNPSNKTLLLQLDPKTRQLQRKIENLEDEDEEVNCKMWLNTIASS